jgi:hypothetical protein
MKNISQTVIYAYEIAEMILWNIADLIKNDKNKKDNNVLEDVKKNVELIYQLILDTNNNLSSISEEFKYKSKYYFDQSFKINPYINIDI